MGQFKFLVMELQWIVKIVDNPNLRVKVKFEPKEELLYYFGQYKLKTGQWVDFTEIRTKIDTDLSEIQSALAKSYDLMRTRLDAFMNISEGFKYIHDIEIEGVGEDARTIIK